MGELRSMTGYGRAAGEVRGRAVAVELRSVNGRGLDVRVRSAGFDLGTESRIEALIRARVERGHVEVRVTASGGGAAALRADVEAAERAHTALEQVRAALGLRDEITLALVAAQPGVIGEAAGDDGDAAWRELEPVARAALDALDRARAVEGEALRRDLDARIGRVRGIAGEIALAAAARPDEARREMEARLSRLEAGLAIDPGRLEQEVALLAQRLDTTEERVRLEAHLEGAASLLGAGSERSERAVGRRLDFLLQEMQRELSTIAAKSQSADVSRLVVDARAEVEKMREQAQNVE